MTIRLMEGFETAGRAADLIQSGWKAQGVVATGFRIPAARYTGGNAFSLDYAVAPATISQTLQKNIGSIGGSSGMAFSSAVRRSSLNSGGVYQRIAKAPTRYILIGNPSNSFVTAFSYTEISSDFSTVATRNTTMPVNCNVSDILWSEDDSLFYLVARTTTSTFVVFSSPDLVTFTTLPLVNPGTAATDPSGQSLTEIGGYLLYTTGGLMKVINKTGWTVVTTGMTGLVTAPINDAANNRWLAICSLGGNALWQSTDNGTTWTNVGTGGNYNGGSMAVGNGILVVADDGVIRRSVNGGTTMTTVAVAGANDCNVAFSPVLNKFVLTGDAITATSEDGVNWSIISRGMVTTNGDYTRRLYVFDSEIVLVSGSSAYRSEDGIEYQAMPKGIVGNGNQTSQYLGLLNPSTGLPALGMFILAGNGGMRVYSGANLLSLGAMGDFSLDAYHIIEGSVSRVDDTNYTLNVSLDGIPVTLSQPNATFPLWPQAVTSYTPVSMANGAKVLYHPSGEYAVRVFGTGSSKSFDDFDTFTATTTPLSNNPTQFMYSDRFFVCASTGNWATSEDGETWQTSDLTALGSTRANNPGDSNGALIFVPLTVGASNGGLAKSIDGGRTFTTVPYPAIPGGVAITALKYVGSNVWIGTVHTVGYVFSLDNGNTWSFQADASIVASALDASLIGAFGKFLNVSRGYALAYDSGTNSVTKTTISTTNATCVTYSPPMNAVVACRTNAVQYSQDGLNWITVSSGIVNAGMDSMSAHPTKRKFLQVVSGAAATTNSQLLYPTFADMDLKFVLSGFDTVDDIVVTDFTPPNAGPQGDCRIYKMPDDIGVQSEWTPVPGDLSNIEAGTASPFTASTSYVESNEIGQSDIYGSSAFNYPAGLRPLAVKVEGNFERVFTNIPVAELALKVSDAEQSVEVPVQTPLGSSTYAEIIAETNVDTGIGWTRETVAQVQAKITKTA